MRSHGKCQPHVHPTRVILHGRVDEFLNFRKSNDLVEFYQNLRAFHSQNRTAQKYILASGEFGVKTGADFQQTSDAAVQLNSAGGGFGDSGNDLEQRRLSGAVSTDNTQNLAVFDFKADILQCPQLAAAPSV